MTEKEKDIQIALGTYLPKKWKERNQLLTEAYRLEAKADRLHTEVAELCAKGYRLWRGNRWTKANELYTKADNLDAEANKLDTEGYKLRVEGDRLFRAAVFEICGPKARIDWKTGQVMVEDNE